jgi:hypothetical protein
VPVAPKTATPIKPKPAAPLATAAPVATVAPVTAAPVTAAPITAAPVTAAPVTVAPVTAAPVTAAPVTVAPATVSPTAAAAVTAQPTVAVPATVQPTAAAAAATVQPTATSDAPVPATLQPTTTAAPIATAAPTTVALYNVSFTTIVFNYTVAEFNETAFAASVIDVIGTVQSVSTAALQVVFTGAPQQILAAAALVYSSSNSSYSSGGVHSRRVQAAVAPVVMNNMSTTYDVINMAGVTTATAVQSALISRTGDKVLLASYEINSGTTTAVAMRTNSSGVITDTSNDPNANGRPVATGSKGLPIGIIAGAVIGALTLLLILLLLWCKRDKVFKRYHRQAKSAAIAPIVRQRSNSSDSTGGHSGHSYSGNSSPPVTSHISSRNLLRAPQTTSSAAPLKRTSEYTTGTSMLVAMESGKIDTNYSDNSVYSGADDGSIHDSDDNDDDVSCNGSSSISHNSISEHQFAWETVAPLTPAAAAVAENTRTKLAAKQAAKEASMADDSVISSLSSAVWQSDSSITGYSDAVKGVTASNSGVGHALRGNMQYSSRAPYSSALYSSAARSDAYSESAATADYYCSNASLILPQHDWERNAYISNNGTVTSDIDDSGEAKETATDYDNDHHHHVHNGGTAGTSVVTSESDNMTATSRGNSSSKSSHTATHHATHSAAPAAASDKAIHASDVHLVHGIKY